MTLQLFHNNGYVGFYATHNPFLANREDELTQQYDGQNSNNTSKLYLLIKRIFQSLVHLHGWIQITIKFHSYKESNPVRVNNNLENSYSQ